VLLSDCADLEPTAYSNAARLELQLNYASFSQEIRVTQTYVRPHRTFHCGKGHALSMRSGAAGRGTSSVAIVDSNEVAVAARRDFPTRVTPSHGNAAGRSGRIDFVDSPRRPTLMRASRTPPRSRAARPVRKANRGPPESSSSGTRLRAKRVFFPATTKTRPVIKTVRALIEVAA